MRKLGYGSKGSTISTMYGTYGTNEYNDIWA